MREIQLKLMIGALLHDIGKVLYRADDGRNHSISGYEFLKDEAGIKDPDILDQVRFHHHNLLKNAVVDKKALCYITYIADNIAAFSERRDNGSGESGFQKDLPLESIFNILNGNQAHMHYQPAVLSPDVGINMPTEKAVSFDNSFYNGIRAHMLKILSEMDLQNPSYINSLLKTMEADLSFVPSSTSRKEAADISLYDHVKMTAAMAGCIQVYLEENGISDYKQELFDGADRFYDKKVFLLYSMDISGIQAFIYHQYGNSDVLKNLRARSFYLEIMLENMVDDILDSLSLSRANLIYTGGGRAYMLLPNTESVVSCLDNFQKKMDAWFLDQFKSDLYVAAGYSACSANELRNQPTGSYRQIFASITRNISDRKAHRYRAADILSLNRRESDKERECRICHRSDHLTEENLCQICSGLLHLSASVLDDKFFTILNEKDDDISFPIGPDRFLISDSEVSLRKRMKESAAYVRSYSKNELYIGSSVSTNLWVGDYSAAKTLEELVKAGTGIRRMGVLRADIDNLGQAFVQGFSEHYQTLSRASSFSRKLSLFFKLHINEILENGTYSMDGGSTKRNISIIYSGGDDAFIVGAWKDVLEFGIDLHKRLQEFAQGTLTISAGYGIYKDKYPISYIASQTGELEDFSKDLEGKNAITLFDEENRYSWDIFIEKVMGEKFTLIYEFFSISAERGKNFLYNLLDLMRNREEKINLARFAYFLARMEPDRKASDLQKELYNKFSKKMYQWMQDAEECRQVITAIYIYAYLVREEDEK